MNLGIFVGTYMDQKLDSKGAFLFRLSGGNAWERNFLWFV